MFETLPLVKIEPNGITITTQYFSFDDIKHYRTTPDEFFKDTGREEYSKFSIGSRSRLKRAFNLLLAISEPRTFINPKTNKKITFLLNFITLTLSAKQGIHSDYDVKYKCLNYFLTDLRRKKGLRHYLWRAEPQKNGNIHFHIATNQFFDWQFIRDTWNNTQKNLGYIDLFNNKHHHINPNSTDIHSVYDIKHSGAYIAKYLKKIDSDSRSIQGKIWDCSRSLKPKEKCLIDITPNRFKELEEFENLFSDRVYISDYFKFYYLDKYDLNNSLPEYWKNEYQNYISKVSNS
jgi:hypothetical protein